MPILDATMRWLIWCALLVSGFCVLPFICFSPRICVWHVWVIGWDCSMFLCPSSPWLCHQSLLHPVVGTLSFWEYVSRRFEATCSWRAWPWNLFQFEHLWHSQVESYRKLALSVCAWNFVSCFSIFCSNHSGTLCSSVLAISMAPIRFFACLIILALSARAADTNSTGIAGNLMENQTKAANLRSAVCCPCMTGGCRFHCCPWITR